MQQFYSGIKVFGGEVVAHADPSGAPAGYSDFALRPDLDPEALVPSLEPSEALVLAERDLRPLGPDARPPTQELVICRPDPGRVPWPGGRVLRVARAGEARWRLAYHVALRLEEPGGPRAVEEMVDAHTGRILARWDALQTHESKGHGFYSGPVTLETTVRKDGTEELRDPTRGSRPHPRFPHTIGTGNVVLDGEFKVDDPTGDPVHVPVYALKGGAWGNGTLFEDDGKTDTSRTPAGLSVAADIAVGLAATWDMYGRVLGRDGIDDKGSTLYSQAHIAHDFANAFWDDGCFCMSYGDGGEDGSMGRVAPLATADITAHELTHGVTAATMGLIYDGESGGLNEATSDIMGSMVKTYAMAPTHGEHIPAEPVPGDVGSVIVDPHHPGDPSRWKPVRRMDKPSLDRESANYWQPLLGENDVHLNSGPMNRAFRFLAAGSSCDPTADTYSPFLPGGMRGLGNDRATHLWYRVMTQGHMPPSATCAQARRAAILAARGPLETRTVKDAFAAINVGLADGPLQVTRQGAGKDDGSVGWALRAGKKLTYQADRKGVKWRVDGPEGQLKLDARPSGACVVTAGDRAITAIRHLTCEDPVSKARTTLGIMVIQTDLDGDGSDDVADLAALAVAYGGGPGACDLNLDGNVNHFDISLYLGSY
jgi:Zn-dependent metalloprotease